MPRLPGAKEKIRAAGGAGRLRDGTVLHVAVVINGIRRGRAPIDPVFGVTTLRVRGNGREDVPEIADVNYHAQPQLFEVVHAADLIGLLFGLGERGQQHGRQNGDNGDDDQQFDQGEGVLFHFIFMTDI